MQTVLRGRKLAWDERGRGTPLVLLHAFPLDRRMWRDLASDLTLDAHVIAPDFAGLGESEGHATIDEAADDVAALLDHLGIERAVVGGLSLGGYVALAFARRHPRRLLGLLLADTRAGADGAEARAARDAQIARIAREGLRGWARELVPKLLSGHDTRARDYAQALAELQSPLGVAGMLGALRDRPDATPGLGAIEVATTIVVGTADALTPPSEARGMASAIAGAEVVEIEGAGHLSVLEAREAFGQAVRGLLARVAATRS